MVLIIIPQTKYEALLHLNNTHQSEQNNVFFLLSVVFFITFMVTLIVCLKIKSNN